MITSNTNSLIKLVSSLHHKKGRLEQKLFLAEGIHLVQEALKSTVPIRLFFWSPKLTSSEEGRRLLEVLATKNEGYEVSESIFAKIAETENPQGVLAVLEIPEESAFDFSRFTLGLIVDGLQDPGNVGTIIRIAWACALDGLIFTPETADPYQGKVVRASQGGIFHQKIYRNAKPGLIAEQAQKQGLQIIAGDIKATEIYFQRDLTPPTLLLIGNEGRGLKGEWENYSIKKVLIPQPGRAESLNVSVSAGVLVYEAIRQRFMKNTCQS
ncbi:MAG: TrmH family RNA methyltransferase [Bacillota bacterium]